VLDELLCSPHTLFRSSRPDEAHARGENRDIVNPQSFYLPPAVVASPLCNAAGHLVGAIYGYRSVRAGNHRRGIRYLEAHMIELLAGAVSQGIARLEHEAEVERRRVLLEQALISSGNHKSLRTSGEEREVTLLFADLRGSTALAAELEMDQAYELLGQVMDCLTAAVMNYDGLVIDYYGDGLSAMWNAPADQADHPELACRAALRMLETLPDVAADWSQMLSTNLFLGVGVHTGRVRVGNAGSRRRAKYGPRGQDVHLASRVEAAAKQVHAPLLATRSTVGRLSTRLATHRVCRARLRGVEQPVDLFAVSLATMDKASSAQWHDYDLALSLFEQGRFSDAADVLRSMDQTIRAIPIRFLADEAERALGRQRRRRSGDELGHTDGIVALT
jgi:adenylate cyclase